MSAYNPPIRNLPIFDTLLFREANPEGEGAGALDPRYCRFPLAQGTLSVPDLNLNTTKIHLGSSSIATGPDTISIGNGAGAAGSGISGTATICIGAGAGASSLTNQNAINIGFNAGSNNAVGRNSINIGRNAGSHAAMGNNCIQINATGVNVSSQTTSSTCVIAPIRNTGNTDYLNDAQLFYNISTSEVYRVNLIAFPQLFSGANTLPTNPGGFVANIRNIVDIPAGLWEFNWSVSSDTVGTTAYGIMVQFGTAPPTTLNVAAGSNYGAVCNRETFNANSSVPMSHYQSFLYESNGAAGLNAYLCGFFSALAAGSFVAADFTLNARKIR